MDASTIENRFRLRGEWYPPGDVPPEPYPAEVPELPPDETPLPRSPEEEPLGPDETPPPPPPENRRERLPPSPLLGPLV